MARLLVLAIAALAVLLTAPPGKQLMTARAARSSPAEAFWRAALPDEPMPEAIRELLHPRAAGTKDPNVVNDKPPLPPLNFKYDDYKSSPRNEAPSPEVLRHLAGGGGGRGDTAASRPTVLCFLLEDAVRVGASLPLRCVVPRAAAAAAGEGAVRERGEVVAAAVACHDVDRARPGGKHTARAALLLVGVKQPGGGAAVVCHAVPGAQGLPAKNDESPSSA